MLNSGRCIPGWFSMWCLITGSQDFEMPCSYKQTTMPSQSISYVTKLSLLANCVHSIRGTHSLQLLGSDCNNILRFIPVMWKEEVRKCNSLVIDFVAKTHNTLNSFSCSTRPSAYRPAPHPHLPPDAHTLVAEICVRTGSQVCIQNAINTPLRI